MNIAPEQLHACSVATSIHPRKTRISLRRQFGRAGKTRWKAEPCSIPSQASRPKPQGDRPTSGLFANPAASTILPLLVCTLQNERAWLMAFSAAATFTRTPLSESTPATAKDAKRRRKTDIPHTDQDGESRRRRDFNTVRVRTRSSGKKSHAGSESL